MWQMEQYFPVGWTNPSQVIIFQVLHENTKWPKRKQMADSLPFWLFLLALELLDDSEVETNDVLGEDNNKTFISVASSYMHRNLKWVHHHIKGTMPLYFPDEFKRQCGMRRQAVHLCSHAYVSRSLHVFSQYLLKLVANPLHVEVRDLNHLSDRKHDKHWCWEAWGSAMLSLICRLEWNFPVILIFQNFRPTSWGTPKVLLEWNSGKCLVHSLPHPEFLEFLVKWKVPPVSKKDGHIKEMLNQNCLKLIVI